MVTKVKKEISRNFCFKHSLEGANIPSLCILKALPLRLKKII